jgi:hypothetical protein
MFFLMRSMASVAAMGGLAVTRPVSAKGAAMAETVRAPNSLLERAVTVRSSAREFLWRGHCWDSVFDGPACVIAAALAAALVPAGNANHAVAKTAPTIHDVELVIRNKPSLATVHAH